MPTFPPAHKATHTSLAGRSTCDSSAAFASTPAHMDPVLPFPLYTPTYRASWAVPRLHLSSLQVQLAERVAHVCWAHSTEAVAVPVGVAALCWVDCRELTEVAVGLGLQQRLGRLQAKDEGRRGTGQRETQQLLCFLNHCYIEGALCSPACVICADVFCSYLSCRGKGPWYSTHCQLRPRTHARTCSLSPPWPFRGMVSRL